MRILFLSDTPSRPATAGNRRRIAAMQDFLRERGATVGMLMLPAVDRAEWDDEAMRRSLDLYAVAPLAVPRPSPASRVLRRLWSRAPVPLDAWCPPAFRRAAGELASSWAADVVVAEYVYLSACLPALRRAGRVTVIDTHDVMHQRPAVYAEAGLAPQWFHTSYRAERRGLRRADLVLAIQPEDAARLGSMLGASRVLTVPHAEPPRPAGVASAQAGRVLIVASYNDLNVVGVRRFLDEGWARLRAAAPSATLEICGSIAQKLGPVPAGVAVRGVVDDLGPAYAGCRVVLAPVVSGTGLKVKAIEALAHARPVVSSRAGARGLACGERQGVFVADDPGAMADAAAALLADEARWRTASHAAAEHARRYAPQVVFGALLARLEAAVDRRR